MTEPSFDVVDVRFEHYLPQNTLGVSDSIPRLSWRFSNVSSDFEQTAYEVEIYDESPQSERSLLCSTNINSSTSRLVPWPAKEPLRSRQRVLARVRAWGTDGTLSRWSTLASLETGLLERKDWCCGRIRISEERDAGRPQPEVFLRKDFSLSSVVAHARLYVAVQGVYEVEIDGQRVGDHYLAPGWTNYNKRIHFQTFDVTTPLSSDTAQHCIGIRVAEGWFSGRLGFGHGHWNIWGEHTTVMAQLEITFRDGTQTTICSDQTWMSASGPTRLAEIYDGEKYDANMEIPAWSQSGRKSGLDNGRWRNATVMTSLSALVELVASIGEPVRRIETIAPIQVLESPSGKVIVDFGQNLVGYTRIKTVRGTKGDNIILHHAEVLDHGELAKRPLRICDAVDEYTLRGAEEGESWEPRFTFHGFRYCQIDGWPTSSTSVESSVEAVVCHTDMEPVGEFSSSNPMLNRLYANAMWSMRGNFLSLPTDCPQRDERLGWTGDIALFAPTATRMFGCHGILKDWMVDVVYEQDLRGGIPALVTPNVLQHAGFWSEIWPCAIWNDVTVLVPWALYEASGDPAILEAQYPSMTKWLASIPRNVSRQKVLWDGSYFQLGDWLDPSASPDEPARTQTDPVLVADAFLIRSLDLVARTARILGNEADAKRFEEEAMTARRQFVDEYITSNGRMVADSQTAYALAICFDLYPSLNQKTYAGERLAFIVRRNNFRISTGFAGTPYICEALVQAGQAQIAYAMLLNEKCPSWLYPITMGATTVWERWDSMLPDGSINPGEMTSFNHYCFGAVALFLQERLAGLQCLQPGWKKIRAAPVLGADFTSAQTSHQTPYGCASCSWQIEGERINIQVVVPPTTSMEVVLPYSPDNETVTVGAGKWEFSGSYRRRYEYPVAAISASPWLED